MKQMSGRTREKLEGAREVLLALLRDKEVYDELVGLGVREITNPAVTFTKHVKNGVWDEISDDVYPMRRKTPCVSYGDIRRVHRIYASN